MRRDRRRVFLVLVLPLAACAAEAQSDSAAITADLVQTVGMAESKVTGLAEAMPAELYGWRPAEGVRSVGDVFMHVAADNYYLPALLGVSPPADTGITDDYETVVAFEARALDKDAIIAELRRSFEFRQAAVSDLPAARLSERVDFFGHDVSVQHLAVMSATHLHEHLGQAIAYARTNGIVPPWSQ